LVDAISTGNTNGYQNIQNLGFQFDNEGNLTQRTGQFQGTSLTETFSYDAFGKRRNADWTDDTGVLPVYDTQRGFTGHDQTTGSGLEPQRGPEGRGQDSSSNTSTMLD